jgi:hypothetical protein
MFHQCKPGENKNVNDDPILHWKVSRAAKIRPNPGRSLGQFHQPELSGKTYFPSSCEERAQPAAHLAWLFRFSFFCWFFSGMVGFLLRFRFFDLFFIFFLFLLFRVLKHIFQI